jgi:hypothetical protein
MRACSWIAIIVEHRFNKEPDYIYEKCGSLHVYGMLEEDAIEYLVRDRVEEGLPLDHEILRLTFAVNDLDDDAE